jgi:hypothetical protein
MYVPVEADQLQADSPDVLERFGHCWCNQTMAEVGPDDRQVGAESCSQSRKCFEE